MDVPENQGLHRAQRVFQTELTRGIHSLGDPQILPPAAIFAQRTSGKVQLGVAQHRRYVGYWDHRIPLDTPDREYMVSWVETLTCCSQLGVAAVGSIVAAFHVLMCWCRYYIDLENREAAEGYVDQVLGREAFGHSLRLVGTKDLLLYRDTAESANIV